MAFLEMRNVTKKFGKVIANEDVNLSIEKQEVHALLGENGAGKSTLMNILYGMYDSYEGDVYFKGNNVNINNPKDAIDLGIGMVHQHFMLIPALTAIENVILGLKGNKEILDLNVVAKRFGDLAKRYNMEIDPFMKVGDMSIGQQQRLEILKALYRNAELLILDEPTAVLTPQEVSSLFDMIRKLVKEGVTIIFISHKLSEIMEICDNCTVLRRGKVADTLPISEVKNRQQLATLMVGKEVELKTNKCSCKPGEEILRVNHLSYTNDDKVDVLKNISFSLCNGEILGICGVDGNGQSELVKCITGLLKGSKGDIFINGKNINKLSSRKILNEGVSHIPEDRYKMAMVTEMTVEENLMLMNYYNHPYSKKGILNLSEIKDYANKICDEYGVKTPSIKELAGNLSGGNQQKFVVGREISRNPELLIAVHPSRGLDIGATKDIQSRLIEERDNGTAILMVSTELDEILELSDRILVMYNGEIMGIVDQEETTREQLGDLMMGNCIFDKETGINICF